MSVERDVEEVLLNIIEFILLFCSEAKDQTQMTTMTLSPLTNNCDTTINQRQRMDSGSSPAVNKQLGHSRHGVDNNPQERPSIKFQLFSSSSSSPSKDNSLGHQSSPGNAMSNNKNHNNNNNSVYNSTTTAGGTTVLVNGPSKLFRIPNLVRK